MSKMKFGLIVPTGSAQEIVKFAYEAEKAGWDGIFYYDDITSTTKPK